jgi:hypothetical protein
MPRKGRALEQLVAELKRVLGPTGVTIQSPEFIIGRNSGKRREVDVSLRTKIGSSAMFVMFECRDRQGRQDVTWIEQVAMKQEDVGANKAVAVCPDGFTKGAQQLAAADEVSQSASVPRSWAETPDGYDAFRRRCTAAYRGEDDQWIFPTVGGNSSPLHPLITWWAILFGLSMLARYEPSSWMTYLDIDGSADAKPLETILDRALITCPELILHTIRSVSG